MKLFWLLPYLVLFLISCKTKELNQYIKLENKTQKRHGKWKEEYPSNEGTLIATGRYKMGEKVGVWKTKLGEKLYQKDRIRKNTIKTKFYYPNGKIMERGQSRLDITGVERHWYYFGKWQYFDENGKLKYIKMYDFGKKVDSLSFLK